MSQLSLSEPKPNDKENNANEDNYEWMADEEENEKDVSVAITKHNDEFYDAIDDPLKSKTKPNAMKPKLQLNSSIDKKEIPTETKAKPNKHEFESVFFTPGSSISLLNRRQILIEKAVNEKKMRKQKMREKTTKQQKLEQIEDQEKIADLLQQHNSSLLQKCEYSLLKEIPSWASEKAILQAFKQQSKANESRKLFPFVQLPVELGVIFEGKKAVISKYFRRTSSVNWDSPPLKYDQNQKQINHTND